MRFDRDIKGQENTIRCFDEGTIQAYIDGELSPGEMQQVYEHLKVCEKCRTKYDELMTIDAFVEDKLAVEEESSNINKDKAWERLSRYIDKYHIKERGVLYMINKYKRAVAGVAAALLIASVIWVAPVRNAAAGFLSIFRVSSIDPITFTQEDFMKIQQQFNEKGIRDIDLKQYGKIKVDGGGRYLRYGTEDGKELNIDVIKKDSGIDFKVPVTPEGFKLSDVNVERSGRIEITPNVTNLNQLISTFGGEKLFPKALTGKTFVISTKDIVHLNYSDRAADISINKENTTKFRYLSITQIAAPDITVPEGVDMEAVRDAVISLPFLPENIKQQLADIKDWKNTLPLPVDDKTAIKEVTINGNKGVLISNQYGRKAEPIYNTTLVWSDGKYMYQISGNLTEQDILQIAESLR